MRNKFILLLIFAGLVFFLAIILFPKTYIVPAFQADPNSKYWDLSSGSRIGYTHIAAKGNKRATPIVFLQGGPGSPIFDLNVMVLSKLAEEGYDVYLYDLVGCGRSNRLDNINEYTVERHTNDLSEIVNKIGAEKLIFIAQSWGAILATNYAADHSSKIEKIIFTGPAPILPINFDLENKLAPDSLHLKSPLFTNADGKHKVYHTRANVVEFFAKYFGYKLTSDKEMDDFASVLNYEMNKSTLVDTSLIKLKTGYGYYVNIKTAQSFNKVPNQRAKLALYNFPILILRGQSDGIKWGYTEEYLQLFKNHKLIIIPKAGHSISTEQPDLYINSILEFLL